MIYEIIQHNFVGVVTIFFLGLFILTNNNFDKKTNRLFLAAAICVLVLIIEEAWEVQLARKETYSALRVLLSAVGYTLRPATACFLVMIIQRNTVRWATMMCIPLLVNTLVAFSALFGPWAFQYTQANEFVRGPLGFVPFVTAGFYVGSLLVMAMKGRRKGDLIETLTVAAIVLLAVIATVLESVFHFRAIQSAYNGISIVFYYMFLHTNQSNRDPLTGALTRRRFYLDAEKNRMTLSAVISLDLNDLKLLNDRCGHMEGDKALIAMTEAVKKHMTKRTSLYRTGGDEFMILCYKMNEEKVQHLIGQIRRELENTPYRCAMGYALFSYQAGFDFVCQKADDAMYENKIQMKRAGQLTLQGENT